MKSFKKGFLTFVHSSLIFVLFGLISCSEEQDEISPRVIVSSPFENESFQSTDTIGVTAIINDNEQVTSVDIELLDLDFNLVGRKESFLVTGSTVNFRQSYPINGLFLESGDYYLAIRASDGNNVGSGFVKIRVTGVPRELEGTIVITKEFNQTTVFYNLANETDFQIRLNFFSDIVGAGLNYCQDILVTAGGEAGDAIFFELGEFSAINSLTGFGNGGLAFFSTVAFSKDIGRFFVAESEGVVRVFDENASQLLAFNALAENIPQEIFGSSEGYFIEEKEIDSPVTVLSHYSFQGLLFDVYLVSGAIRAFFDLSFTEKFVWVDNPAGFELRLLNLTNKGMSLAYQRIDSRLHDVIRVEHDIFILSTSEGLFRYNFSNGGISPINESAPEGDLYYDDLNGLIYLVTGTEITIFTILGNQLGGLEFDQEIVFVGFDYNR